MRFFLIVCSLLFTFSHTCAESLSDRQKYLLARELLSQKLYGLAYEKLNEISKDYLLYDYVLLDKSFCLTKIGEQKKAEETLNIVIDSYKGYPSFRKAYKNLLTFVNDKDRRLKILNNYLANFPDDKSFVFEKALILKDIDEKESKNILKMIFLEGGNQSLLAFKEIENLLSSEEIYRTALKMIKNNNFQAIELIKKLHEEDIGTKYLYGLYYFKNRDYKRAIYHLKELNFEDSEKLLALCYLRIKDYDSFFPLVDSFIEKGKKSVFDIVYASAEQKRRMKDYDKAIYYFNFLFQEYPDKYEENNFGLAWLYIRLGDYEKAKNILENLVESKIITNKDKYYFWLGKIEEYKGNNGEKYFSKLRDKEGFYYLRLFPYSDNGKHESKKSRYLSSKISQILKRLDEFATLNMKDEALEEMKYFNSELAMFPDILGEYLLKFGSYNRLVALGSKENLVFYKYPFPYKEFVIHNSKLNGVDPFLAVAIMREESHFNPQVVSDAGALGLMQLMPFTAKKVGNVKSKNDLFKEELNISLGIKYFGELLRKYKKIEYAISAYNAGENAVDAWLKNDYKDIDEFIEDIPYRETKNYVKKVLRTYYIMKHLYKINLNEMADAS